ncbi:MAG: class I poly(R)-hydroxyalkanoic acid synthase [Alphaproteobacteria bacterium]|nr:class I poly(R)-hydroxyalkanoic acid synthase [Alphaproteobacteria bacterium]
MQKDNQSPWDDGQLENMTKEFTRLMGEAQQAMLQQLEKKPDSMQMLSAFGMSKTFFEAYQELLKNPQPIQEATDKYLKECFDLWQSMLMLPGQKSMEKIKESIRDKRFKDPLWSDTPYAAFLMQSYLMYAQWAESVANDLEGLDEGSRRKFKFYTRQMVDALSPSNFAWSNPIVLKKTIESQGQNLLKGMRQFIEDMGAGKSLMNIQNTDRDAFELGRDLASTPGKIVFQNHLMQLIQYTPQTESVNQIPVLVVPPWINKYYILDLQPHNSLAKWLVEQGNTVFMISWVNPGQDLKDTDFEDYLKYGSLEAMQVIQDITAEKKTNLVGFCLGGISLAVLMGYLKEKASESINSLTLMASPLDFSQAGELTLFMEPEFLGQIAGRIEEMGLLDGAVMGATFNMLRANDLIWSAFINNYLLANEQQQFDMLYWNADNTNLPSKMFNYYIQEMYVKNGLIQPNSLKIMGQGVDISQADVPVFIVATHDDHIAPWKSMYEALGCLKGPVKFVLGGSGHVAGIINHPDAKKYGHWQNADYSVSADEWLKQAAYSHDSWWLAWKNWIEDYKGFPREAIKRKPGKGKYKVIEEAPGSYVRVSSQEAMRKSVT